MSSSRLVDDFPSSLVCKKHLILIPNSPTQGSHENSGRTQLNPPARSHGEIPFEDNRNDIRLTGNKEAEATGTESAAYVTQKKPGEATSNSTSTKEDRRATSSRPPRRKFPYESRSTHDPDEPRLPYSADQLTQLRYQIYAFKCLSKNMIVPETTQNILFGDTLFQ